MLKKIRNILNKKNKEKIVSLTAYSKNIAQILDRHCDIILVGDSMANVLYGMENTHKITLDTIIQHSISVKKGIKNSLLVSSWEIVYLAGLPTTLLLASTSLVTTEFEPTFAFSPIVIGPSI